MHFDHFNLDVPADQLELIKDFYGQLFGWRPGPRPAFSRPGYWLYQGQQPLLHLTQCDTTRPEAGQSTGALNHLAFRSDDLQPIVQRLAALQVPYDLRQIPGQPTRQLFLRDPLGLRIEINGPLL